METDNTFVITNMENFAEILLRNAIEELSLDQYLDTDHPRNIKEELMSTNSVRHIISKYILDIDENNDPIISTDAMDDIFDETCEYIFQMHLSKLCGEDKIECAWDNDSNQMVFWSKNLDK